MKFLKIVLAALFSWLRRGRQVWRSQGTRVGKWSHVSLTHKANYCPRKPWGLAGTN